MLSVTFYSLLSWMSSYRVSLCWMSWCHTYLCCSFVLMVPRHSAWQLGNCDIDFFNFPHRKVWNFKILILFKRNWCFAVIFWKYWKRNQKCTKYFKTSQKSRVIPLKFWEMSLVLSNLINYCKIAQFLVKFWKISEKDW